MIKPYKFKPFLKETIWGGKQLAQLKGLADEYTNIGESWEISGLAAHESICIDGGIDTDGDKGLSLSQLIDKHKQNLVGAEAYTRYGNKFPILAKFIDSDQNLSIQVHPGDDVARRRHGCDGKSEMWYVVKTQPGSLVFTGMKRQMTPDQFVNFLGSLSAGDEERLSEVINTHATHEGDVYFLPAGRLHAIGAGNLLAEIQQSSDITYRVFDYCRLEANGKPRELHVELAKDAIDYRVQDDYSTSYDTQSDNAELVTCPSFSVRRVRVSGSSLVDLGKDSFVIVMCLKGCADVNGMLVGHGESLLVPAIDNKLRLQGKAALLTATI